MSTTNHSNNRGLQASRLHQVMQSIVLAAALSVLATAKADGSDDKASASRKYHISSGTLSQALRQFATDSGLLFSAEAKLTAGKTTAGLDGEYSVEEGFKKLLAGSGLTYIFTGNDAVTIKIKDSGDDASVTLPAISVIGETVSNPDDPYNKSYTVTNSSTATKTDTPLIETPVSVQIVPRSVLDDQKATRVKDALENVSGVRAQPTLGGGNGFIIRGFRNNRVYRNGLLANADGFPTEIDAGNLQSIDVLKGPAAVLFGRVEPGGLINIITKKPLDTPYYSLEQQIGSYDFYRTQWDATGPVTEDNKLLYRFTGAYQNNNSFRDFIFTDRVLVNPSITWKPTEQTDLTLGIEGLDQDYQADFGIPAIGTRPAPIPINRSLDDPNTPIDHLSHTLISAEINHRFNADWAIHNRFLAGFEDESSSFVNPAPTFGNALQPNGILRRNIFGQVTSGENYATNLDLTGKFNLGFSKHQVLVGVDYFTTTQKYHSFGEFNDPNPLLDINIFNPGPSYGIDPALIRDTLSRPANCCADSSFLFATNEWFGTYFQDQITLWDKLHILGGGRYDWANSGASYSSSFELAEAALSLNRVQGFSPRVGILYQPVHWLGVYGNWTTSFNANNAPAADGTSFDPERGEQFEGGLKAQLFNDQLIATLAYYDLIKDNILVNDLNTPNPFDKIANKQGSKGFEFDFTGQITDRISLIGSYAYTDAKTLVDHNGSNAGNRLPNVPEHAGSLWFKYDINGHQAQEGFSFGVGQVAAGSRQGDFENSFQLPGYVRVDAFAAYKLKVGATKITTQFNIRNLLDKKYYESTDPNLNISPRLGIAPGAPLTAIGSIRVEY
ncbi:MAG: TonB-dependent receptor [Methylococcaceae bacterium]